MNVSAQNNIAYAVQTNNTHKPQIENKEESVKPFDINDLKLKMLDDKGNDALNSLLIGRTDQEKETIKIILDRMLSTQFSMDDNGKIKIETFDDNSRETILSRLDKQIENQELGGRGNNDILQIMKQLRELYKADYSPLDIKA